MKSVLSSLLVQAALMAVTAVPGARERDAEVQRADLRDIRHIEIAGNVEEMAIVLTAGGELRLLFDEGGTRGRAGRPVLRVGVDAIVLDLEGSETSVN